MGSTSFVEYKNVGKVLKWKRAKEYCSNLSLSGYEDWRLPSAEELEALYKHKFDLSYYVPAFSFWSSSVHTCANHKNTLKLVDFKDGTVANDGDINTFNNVRCVRSDIKKVDTSDDTEESYYTFNVTTTPSLARVRIMDIKPKYYDGIKLLKGEHDISISKKGYISERFFIMLDEDTSLLIDLKKVKKPKRNTKNTNKYSNFDNVQYVPEKSLEQFSNPFRDAQYVPMEQVKDPGLERLQNLFGL